MKRLTDENALDENKKKTKNYLTMSLIGLAFKFLNWSKNPKDIWEALEEDFVPTEEYNRYELKEEFQQCTMEDDYSNPTDWFNHLDEINTKLSNIDWGNTSKERTTSNYRLGWVY